MALCSCFAPGPTFHPWSRSCLCLLASPIPTLPGPSSGSVRWHPGLSLGQLSCHSKSAPIIRHLVPALSREQKEPGQTDPGWRREGNQALGAAAWDTPSFSWLVPGGCARPEWAADHRGARGVEGGEYPGAWLQALQPLAAGGVGVGRAAAQGPRSCAPCLRAFLLPSLQLRGPRPQQERALGKLV